MRSAGAIALRLLRLAWVAGLAGAASAACAAPADDALFLGSARRTTLPPVEEGAAGEISVPPPPFTEGVYPCSECHANLDPDPKPRTLEEHTQIALNHGPRDHWCFDCHQPDDRDVLHLAGGKRIPFSESYRLCGQCHGDKYRDWRVGVHGKRTGSWNGKKQYLLCAHCHNPHSPAFKPLAPLPPPRRPEAIL